MKTHAEKIGAVTVAISLALLFCVGLAFAFPTPSITSGPVINVSMTGNSFSPQAIVVGAPNTTSGEFATIIWTNNGAVSHTVTSGSTTPTPTPDGLFDSGIMSPGGTFTLQLNQTMYNSIVALYPDGLVHYYCSIHYSLGMVGTLTASSIPVPEFSSFLTLPLLMTLTLVVVVFVSRRSQKAPGEPSL